MAESQISKEENCFRAVEYREPEWIPIGVSLMPATWSKYREALEEIVVRHPQIFGAYEKGSQDFDDFGGLYEEGTYTDEWGCRWENIAGGLDSLCVGHPLEDWSALEDYTPPKPDAEGLPHGFMYMKLYYLRGFENFMIDLLDEPPQLQQLIDMVLDYNVAVVQKMVAKEQRIYHFGDDLGMQDRLAMGPELWRRYMKPCFAKIYAPCRETGAHVYMHTDGHVLPIIGDLIECGVTVLNPQIRANGLDGLERECKGKVCINLDLDRQLFPFCTPGDIREHVHEAVVRLAMPEGGLMLHAECEPDVPLENIEAVCQALEAHMDYVG
jgi:uroporphyrinogen decarboxylase